MTDAALEAANRWWCTAAQCVLWSGTVGLALAATAAASQPRPLDHVLVLATWAVLTAVLAAVVSVRACASRQHRKTRAMVRNTTKRAAAGKSPPRRKRVGESANTVSPLRVR